MDTQSGGGGQRVAHEHRWLDTELGPLAVHLSVPAHGGLRGACLVLPPIGYPYLSGYPTVRHLAESLAGHGVAALRLDYHGTGNSAGTGLEPDRPAAWERSAALAFDALRSATDQPVGIVGFQLGALLAARLPRPRAWTVLWEPPPSGRRFVSSTRLLGQPVPEDGLMPGGGVSVGGFPFGDATLETLESWGSIDPGVPLGHTLVLADSSSSRLLKGHDLTSVTASLTVRPAPSPSVLQQAAEDAVPAYAEVDGVADWIAEHAAPEPSERPLDLPGADLEGRPLPAVVERVVTLGRSGLHAVSSAPADEPDPATRRPVVAVFLNSGSEMDIGSGRAWLDYARALAAAGHETLRLDWSGWGESPHRPAPGDPTPGRPYDPHCVTETEEVVDALSAAGKDVVLIGLCAGAWVALRVALTRRLAGVVALNPQLYWREGDPVEALITDTSARRTDERRREATGARWGIWTALDVLGVRGREAAWLTDLGRRDFPTHLIFAAGDEGLLYLENRLGRRTARVTRTGTVTVRSVPGIDHSMHRLWLRGPVRAAIIDFVQEREHDRGR